MMGSMAEIVWHYTYGDRLNRIIKSGALLPPAMVSAIYLTMGISEEAATKEFRADMKMLLFSSNSTWEPASYRGVQDRATGEIIDVHRLEEYAQYGMEVFRIGVNSSILHPYLKFKRLARLPTRMARALEEIARGLGSNPYQWWGSLKPVNFSHWLAVEQWVGNQWVGVQWEGGKKWADIKEELTQD